MRKGDIQYIEGKLERINKQTGANLVIFMNDSIGAKVNPLGGVHVLKTGTARELIAYVDGVMDGLCNIQRLALHDENGVKKDEDAMAK